jgi:hypothetical protein
MFAAIVTPAFAQIQTTDFPADGFADRIRGAVDSIWLIDTHEHLITEDERIARAADIDFTYLFSHYAKEDLISAGNAKGLIDAAFGNTFDLQDRWHLFKPFFDASRNTGYNRTALIAARDIYGISDIDSASFEALSNKLRQASKPGLYFHILKQKSRIELSIQDLGHRQFDPSFYRHVERFDNFIHVTSGNEIRQIGQQYDLNIESLEDYLSCLRKAFEQGIAYGMVGVKSGLAYQRILRYDNISYDRARIVFDRLSSRAGAVNLNSEETKAFQDFMMHRLLDLVGEHDLPMQIHTGLQAGNGNLITNSRPTHLVNLFMEHPDVRFSLFHSGYPYGDELATLAKNFANVFIDMCWMPIISPSVCMRYLHEYLETVPANKITVFGGDYSIVEAVYAHSVMTRRIVTKVLVDKVHSGYLSETEAIHIANRILRDNAIEIFSLDENGRNIADLEVLQKPGELRDWWQLHNSKEGFIRDWMVIGPFDYGIGLDGV